MKPTVGIICEYDPFHRGHARQFALVRQLLPGARIVCVMSGCFTQRGSPALFSPAFRAEAALRAGADLVLELPCALAVREAENFALGGVSILAALGFVTHLSFGCETDDLPLLTSVAALLEKPDASFFNTLRETLSQGKPFAAAQAAAIAESLSRAAVGAPQSHDPPQELPAMLARPNNILGICYLRALHRLRSGILPLPVRREGDYHADTLLATGFPSASAARKAFLAGDRVAAERACGYPLPDKPFHRPEALDFVLLQQLRAMSRSGLRALPDCAEGLENRLARAAREAISRQSLLLLLKTRRYAYARLNRLVSHAMLGVTEELLHGHPLPEYSRLLGFRRESDDCLAALGSSGLPIIAKAADGDRYNPLFALDTRAYDLWALGAGLPAGMMFRQPILTV